MTHARFLSLLDRAFRDLSVLDDTTLHLVHVAVVLHKMGVHRDPILHLSRH